MIDLNSGSGYAPFHKPDPDSIGYHVNKLIDDWLHAEKDKEKPRSYVSTSGIGRACIRQIQYDYKNTPKDEGAGFTGKTLRYFQSGHEGEKLMAHWMQQAGFILLTADDNGKQFGFADALKDGIARSRGHIDGVLVGCAHPVPMKFPALWENKIMGSKTWNKVVKHGLAIANPVYAMQMAIYQARLNLHENPGLFTAKNRDTWEVYAELIPFDSGLAQEGEDKTYHVIKATDHNEILPRCAAAPDHFECKNCSYAKRCWEIDP